MLDDTQNYFFARDEDGLREAMLADAFPSDPEPEDKFGELSWKCGIILDALTDRPKTAHEIGAAVNLTPLMVSGCLNALRRRGVARVAVTVPFNHGTRCAWARDGE